VAKIKYGKHPHAHEEVATKILIALKKSPSSSIPCTRSIPWGQEEIELDDVFLQSRDHQSATGLLIAAIVPVLKQA